jgi:hypothetical protein
MSWPWPINSVSAGAAKSGVPMNASRNAITPARYSIRS